MTDGCTDVEKVLMGAVLINERLSAGEPGGQGMEDSGF